MPKIMNVDPAEVRKPGRVELPEILINQYATPVIEERSRYSDEEIINVHRDMAIIREFETMLNLFKTKGEYRGIVYDYPGAAHLSIGQEPAAVGMALNLTVDDHIFGSHRSHGEILAKGLRSIALLDDEKLMSIMKDFFDGEILAVVEKDHTGSVKDLAQKFLVFGSLAEVFGRRLGFNRGLGGSMHAFFPPFGIFPNNAIVGGSADIAAGAALFKRINKKPGLVVANIGDASLGCGPVWEGISFAAMDQYRTLWNEAHNGGLPVIFNFMNNHYGMGGQTCGETMGYKVLARFGAGVNPEGAHAERVDGYSPLAVADAYARKREVIEKGLGPVILDTITYRMSGHSPSDSSSYRSKEEMDAWAAADGIPAYAKEIVEAGIATDEVIEGNLTLATELVELAVKLSINNDINPRFGEVGGESIEKVMFSNTHVEAFDETREPESLAPLSESPRVKQIERKSRVGVGENGAPLTATRAVTTSDALFEAIAHRFFTDPTMAAWGEENRDWGGAFGVYRGLTEVLPYHRLFNSAISEAAIVGAGVGYALEGGRALVELMYCDFIGRAGDELINQMSKWQSMSAGVLKMPLVLRVSVGSKYGAQHSQDLTAMLAHLPGIKVVFPATPYDAKGLMNSALAGTDPVVFFESQRLYNTPELFAPQGVPEEYYELEIGSIDVKRAGTDITILTTGSTLYTAMKAADTLQEKYGISAELIDARSLVPFDYEPLLASVKKTGRLVLASDACARGSIMNTIATDVQQMAFDDLDAPVTIVGARNWITPCHEMEPQFFPQPEWILDAIHERVLPLEGHVVSTNWTTGEMIRRAKSGT